MFIRCLQSLTLKQLKEKTKVIARPPVSAPALLPYDLQQSDSGSGMAGREQSEIDRSSDNLEDVL